MKPGIKKVFYLTYILQAPCFFPLPSGFRLWNRVFSAVCGIGRKKNVNLRFLLSLFCFFPLSLFALPLSFLAYARELKKAKNVRVPTSGKKLK
jgi:hypothetical protein